MSKYPHAKCHECPLADKPMAPTQGPKNAKAAVVSRSPGYHEAKVGKPFSGPSGKVLDFLLQQNGVKREDILVTNVVLCAPDAGKVPPEAIKACSERVRHELQDVPLVIAAGSEAVNLLVGRGAIDRFRGYRIERGNTTFVATNNPALVLRDDATFPNLVKDFKRAFNPLPPPKFPDVEVITDGMEARSFIKTLLNTTSRAGSISCDLETRGGLSHKARIVTLQVALDPSRAYVLSESNHEQGIFKDENFVRDYLRPLFASKEYQFLWHNGIFDTKILRYGYGCNARVDHDTLLLNYACDERQGVHELEYCLMEEFGWPYYTPDSVKRFKKTGIVEDYEELWTYAGLDAAGTYQLFDTLSQRAKEQDVWEKPYLSINIPAARLIGDMELRGMVYDVEAAADIHDHEVGPELDRIKSTIQKLLENPLLNPNSPIQMAALFYDDWKIRHAMQKRPDKKRSVDDSAREEVLAGRFTFPEEQRLKVEPTDELRKKVQTKKRLIVKVVREYDRWQELQKQDSTYIRSLIERAIEDPERRVYTQLLLHGTNSGRLSSRGPNLQNITRTKEGLPNIRRLFVASPGTQIVQADYSQAELRAIACFSGDTELTRIYTEDLDLHGVAAERFYGNDYTSEQRSRAKNMNFGVAYWQGADTFQEKHEIPKEEAQKFIDWWWKNFSGVKKWQQDEVLPLVHKPGYLTSPFGNKRRFYLITQENRNEIYRQAVNFYPQNAASQLTLTSAILINEQINPDFVKSPINLHGPAWLCLTVHDSILAEVKEEYIDEYSTIVRQIMESRAKDALGWTLPFKADIAHGPNWADAK